MYKVLDSISIIRLRPGMFIGDTQTPTHLVHEVLDNALDEVINNRADTIDLYIQDNEIWCSDNGKGMNVYKMKLQDGTFDSVEVLCTRLFSGSKFDTNDYKKLLGMHGVGLVSVNALSEWMVVITKSNDTVYKYNFVDSKLASKETLEDYEFSTTVGFKPSQKYFKTLDINLSEIIQRLILSSAIYNCRVTLNGNKIPQVEFDEYIKTQLNTTSDNIKYIYSDVNNESLFIAACVESNSNEEAEVSSVVNTRFLSNSKFQQLLLNTLRDIIQEKLDKKFSDVPSKYLTTGLKLFLILQLNEPKYDSQTKIRLVSNLDYLLTTSVVDELKKFVSENISVIQENIERKIKKKVTSDKIKKDVNIAKLRDCENIPGERIYILEGDSADGTLKKVRDTKTEAIFPLRGKIINVESSSLNKINNNKEVRDLLKALGAVNARRYKRICILADADPDGFHIVVLLIILIYKFARDYIEQGRVDVIIPPLYMVQKGKKRELLYGTTDLAKYRQEGYEIIRFKGLGEMDDTILSEVIRNGMRYTLEAPQEDLTKKLLNIITDTQLKRELVNSPVELHHLIQSISTKRR